ncbi:MAG: magnesium/cobalt transporter CorA [Deltaproteobacteria bacterium]|nr:magnesium/cobalt transporter CorA [Deltaproteobacteria bacterium]
MFTLHVFPRTGGHRLSSSLDELPALVADPSCAIWLDLHDPTADEGRVLTDIFRFHQLAVEDALQEYGHPKIDPFEDHIFCIVHGLDFASARLTDGFDLDTQELDIFFGNGYLVTHHAGMRAVAALHDEVAVEARRPWSSVRLFHRLLDLLVDAYLPVMDEVGVRIEKLEDRVIHDPSPAVLESILSAKKSILRLRRVTYHQRSILESLARGHLDLIPAESLAFFRDVHDHFVRVADLAESYRESSQGTMEAYLSITSNKLNEIMKVLTLISTIMLPLTFIAGIYGMNFDHMPELHWQVGYPLALAAMAVTAVGLVGFFRRRGWL